MAKSDNVTGRISDATFLSVCGFSGLKEILSLEGPTQLSAEDMSVSVRSLRKRDVSRLILLEENSFSDEQEIIRFDSDRLRKVVTRMNGIPGMAFQNFCKLLRWEPLKVLVAEVNGEVVGATIVDLSRKVGYIHRVTVHPDYRRKGVGTKLMMETLRFLQGRTRQVVLHVASTNAPAKTLYRKFGFSKFEDLIYLFAKASCLHIPNHKTGICAREASASEYSYLGTLMHSNEYLQPEILEKNTSIHLANAALKSFVDRNFMKLMVTYSEKRILATDDDNLVGCAELSCTNKKEPGRIKDIRVFSGGEYEQTVDVMIKQGLNCLKTVGAEDLIAVASKQDLQLIRILEKIGFRQWLMMEGLILRFKEKNHNHTRFKRGI